MIAIIDCGTSELEYIQSNLHDLGYRFRVILLDELKDADFSLDLGVIISGAPTLLTQIDRVAFLEPFFFIRTMHIPILGICLGHQIIGLLHGAEIFREKYIEKMEEIKVIEENILFAGIAQSTYFQEAHSEYITLPEGFVHLARSASCENEAMKHPSKNIFGTQFHPEISGENGAMIFRNFLGICVG